MSRKLTLEYDETRTLGVHFGTSNTRPFRVQASSETGNVKDGRCTESKTWRFDEDGAVYRVQIQKITVTVTGDADG